MASDVPQLRELPMRTTDQFVPSMFAVALLCAGCLSGQFAAAQTSSASATSAPAAASRDRKAAAAKSVPADPAAELLAAVKALSVQVEEQTKLIGQLQQRLDDYSRQANGRLLVTCLAAMTAVPSPDWGLPIGKADKAGILAACSRSEVWKTTYFDASHSAFDVFAPFR
jgi:hypothetical protein